MKAFKWRVLVSNSTPLRGTHPHYFRKSACLVSVLITLQFADEKTTELVFFSFVLQVYKCIQKNCELSFPDQDSFLEHIHTHNEDQDLQYRCHFCSKVFNALDKLSHHQHEQHSTFPQAKKTVGPRYKLHPFFYICKREKLKSKIKGETIKRRTWLPFSLQV